VILFGKKREGVAAFCPPTLQSITSCLYLG
jgi:hypothetical protein